MPHSSPSLDFESLGFPEAERRALRQPTVQDVFLHARNDTIVQMVLEGWKHGYFRTWEEAMVACVCYLADDRAKLLRTATMSFDFNRGAELRTENGEASGANS